MPTFRDFVALGVGTAIALLYTKPSASKDLPLLTPSEGRTLTHERTVFEDRGLATAHPPLTPEDSLLNARENLEAGNKDSVIVLSIAPASELSQDAKMPVASTSDRRQATINPEGIQNASEPSQTDRSQITPGNNSTLVQTPLPTPSIPILDEPETPGPEFPRRTTEPLLTPAPTRDIPAPTLLDPSANPLLFPTRPQEVEIQTTQPITLEQAIELAQRNNRQLEAARLTLERTQFALQEALAAEFPTANVVSEFVRADSAQAERQLARMDPFTADTDTVSTTFEGRLELSYNAYTAGRRPATIQAAREQIRFQQLEVERLSEDLNLNVTNAYYDLQQADAQVEISQAAVTDAARSLRDAQLLEQAGLGTRFEVLQAQVELANNNQGLTNAISQQRIARRRLVQVLNLDQQVAVSAADPIQVAGNWNLSLEESIILAFKNRAELEQQLAQRNISQQQRRIALAAIRPQLSLFTSYNILAVLDDDFGIGPTDGFTLGARLQWNFFDGGAAQARAAQEELNEAIAETNFANQRDQVRFQVEQAFFDLRANDENIQTAALALEQAQESLRLARLRFQAGVGTQTDVINQQTALTRSRINLLTAILDYNRALATLQRAISNLPDGNLFNLP